jgi:hypothetical protein
VVIDRQISDHLKEEFMAKNVNEAFSEFMKEIVNLDQSRVATARSSRDWLLGRIDAFPRNDITFPLLCSENNLNYGSFERKTKTRPLDDIDMMVCITADSCTYLETSITDIKIYFPDNYIGRLSSLRHTTSGKENTLSSTRVVNKFVKNLGGIEQYSKAEIKRTGEAATLKLTSYDWNFDILPCFITQEALDGRTYYLIPNGSGDWKKTDPRKDRARLSSINQSCNGRVLNVIRALKFWNQRPYKTRVSSYLLETMISDYYQNEIHFNREDNVSSWIDLELIKVFGYLRDRIYSVVSDPKNIAYDINDTSSDTKYSMYLRLNDALGKANMARQYEGEGKQKEAIKKWQEVFGDNFPNHTEV